jgi:hypothetical protein
VCFKTRSSATGASRSWQQRRGAWRPAVAREVVAWAEEGSKEGEQGQSRERTTRGGHPSRRWSDSGGTAATARCPAPAAGGQSRAARARGRRREGRGPGGLFRNFKNLRGLSIKQDFH